MPGVRAVVQRVREASVTVDGEIVGRIGTGLCVLLGVGLADGPAQADRMAERLHRIRLFAGPGGAFDRSVADLGAGVLVVSQFTLLADTSKGRRPSLGAAAPAERAEPLVDRVAAALRGLGAEVAVGRFGADMAVALVNDGPVTVSIET